MTTEQLQELLSVAVSATHGEWVASGNGIHVGIRCVATTHADDREQRVADAEHIASFDPATCAELVREVMRLREDLRILTKGKIIQS